MEFKRQQKCDCLEGNGYYLYAYVGTGEGAASGGTSAEDVSHGAVGAGAAGGAKKRQ